MQMTYDLPTTKVKPREARQAAKEGRSSNEKENKIMAERLEPFPTVILLRQNNWNASLSVLNDAHGTIERTTEPRVHHMIAEYITELQNASQNDASHIHAGHSMPWCAFGHCVSQNI